VKHISRGIQGRHTHFLGSIPEQCFPTLDDKGQRSSCNRNSQDARPHLVSIWSDEPDDRRASGKVKTTCSRNSLFIREITGREWEGAVNRFHPNVAEAGHDVSLE
jgi:hypothetical protein